MTAPAAARARYPPEEALPRSILVRNISPIATPQSIEAVFSYCGTIESHRVRRAPSSVSSGNTQEAVVIFADPKARADALVMDSSTIDDKPVSITPVPPNFDFNSQPAHQPMQNNNFFATGMAAFGDLFSGVGTVVAAEMDKAGKIIDSATDTGVLKTAKDQVGMAAQRTREIATDIDDKWHVRDNIINVAETGKSHATSVASVVANQTKQVAEQMDKSLHISENTGKLAEKARGNPTVNGGISAITGGFATLMAQTGLTASQTDANARSSAHSAPPREDSTAAPPADSQ